MAAKPVIFTILLIILVCVTVPTLAARDPSGNLKDKAPLVAALIGKPLTSDACNYCGGALYCCTALHPTCCSGRWCCRHDLNCCGPNHCC